MLTFQEELLRRGLEGLPSGSRVAFAAGCAQRIADVYRHFLTQGGKGGRATVCDDALNYVWTHVRNPPDKEIVDRAVADVMAFIPDQDAPGWTPLTAYAEDALSALAYCLTCLRSGDAQDAAWAGRRVYEAIDYFVTTRDDVMPDDPAAEARVLADPLVQAELERQARDLQDLRLAANSLSERMLSDLQRRSESEHGIPAVQLSD